MVDKVSQRLISVLDAIKDGIYIIDSDYTLEFMNKAIRYMSLVQGKRGV